MKLSFTLLLIISTLFSVQAQYNDVPVTELYNTGPGNFQVAQGGTSFYPDLTSGTFTVDVPACAAGAPTIDKVYINYYERYRTSTGLTPVPAFENNIDIEVNGSGAQNFAAVPANVFTAIIEAGPRAFYRNHVVLDITSFFTANYQAGTNTINITNFNLPAEQVPASFTNDHYGVAITVIYSCDEFEEASVSYYSGLDFYWIQDAGVDYSGPYSAPVCITVPPDANNSRTVSVKSILGGQANAVAPFRGNRVYYLTGTGTPPADPAIQPTGVIATDANAIEMVPQNTAYTSNLGQEWDAMDATVTLPAGDEWICIQYVSEDYVDDGGISGDVLAPVFTVPSVNVQNNTDNGDFSYTCGGGPGGCNVEVDYDVYSIPQLGNGEPVSPYMITGIDDTGQFETTVCMITRAITGTTTINGITPTPRNIAWGTDPVYDAYSCVTLTSGNVTDVEIVTTWPGPIDADDLPGIYVLNKRCTSAETGGVAGIDVGEWLWPISSPGHTTGDIDCLTKTVALPGASCGVDRDLIFETSLFALHQDFVCDRQLYVTYTPNDGTPQSYILVPPEPNTLMSHTVSVSAATTSVDIEICTWASLNDTDPPTDPAPLSWGATCAGVSVIWMNTLVRDECACTTPCATPNCGNVTVIKN